MKSPEGGLERRRRTQKGAEALEATMTFVLFFGFLFLIMDISMAVFIRGDLQTAAEAGVRTGITENLNGASYLSDAIVTTVAQNSKGFLSQHTAACTTQVQYYDPDANPPGYVTTLTSGHNTILLVTINNYTYRPMGPILQGPKALNLSAVATGAMQPCANGVCPAITNPLPPTCP